MPKQVLMSGKDDIAQTEQFLTNIYKYIITMKKIKITERGKQLVSHLDHLEIIKLYLLSGMKKYGHENTYDSEVLKKNFKSEEWDACYNSLIKNGHIVEV